MKRSARRLYKAAAGAAGVALVVLLVAAGVACNKEQDQEKQEPQPATQTGPAGAAAPMGRGMSCAEHFKAFDKDGNREVTKEEFLAVGHRHATAESMFNARDKNSDGKLSEAEFCAKWKGRRGRAPGMGMGRATRRQGSPHGPGMMGRGMMRTRAQCPEHFKTFDKDGSGGISEEEFISFGHGTEQARQVFKTRDTNKDGQLSRDEFCVVPAGPGEAAGAPPGAGGAAEDQEASGSKQAQ